MPVEVTLPKLTHDMQAGVFVEWYKSEGDPIERGEVLYAVETDKATVDVEAEADGILGGVIAQPGDEIAIGQVIAYLLAPGERAPTPERASPAGARRAVPSLVSAPRAPGKTAPSDVLPGPGDGVRVVATPLARRVAREKGLDLRAVRGSGPHGRVVRADVVRAAAGQPPTAPQYEVIGRTHIQDRAAARLTQMWQETPQFVLEISADMTEAIRWREGIEDQMSFTTLLVRAIAVALGREPQVNSLLVEGELRRYQAVNVGVAMATGAGLVVPVIHHADRLTAGDIQGRLRQLRARAEAGRLEPADFSDGTFTLSNLGMYGVDAFTAIINPPQVAILACGRIVETPVELSGQVALRPMLRLRLTVDHRALDGARAAPFLLEVKHLLENPHLLT